MPKTVKGKERGRAGRIVTPPLPPESIIDADSDVKSVCSQNDSPVKSKSKKTKLIRSDPTPEEDTMVEWLTDNPIMFNKKLSSYKDNEKDG